MDPPTRQVATVEAALDSHRSTTATEDDVGAVVAIIASSATSVLGSSIVLVHRHRDQHRAASSSASFSYFPLLRPHSAAAHQT